MASFAGLGNLSDQQMLELASSVVRDILAGPSGGIPTQSTRNMALQLYDVLSNIMTPEWQPDFLKAYFTPPAGMSVTPRTLEQLRGLAEQEYQRTLDWDRALSWVPRGTMAPTGGTRTAYQALQDLAWRSWIESAKEGRAWNPITRQWEMTQPTKESLFGIFIKGLGNIPNYIQSVLGGGTTPRGTTSGSTTPGKGGAQPGTTKYNYSFQDLKQSLDAIILAMSLMGGADATRAALTEAASKIK